MSSEQQDPRRDTPQESLDARGRNRRRLSKAALGAAPVLMTLHAAPLKAAGANCMPSGWISGNTSRHDQPEHCGGLTPGYWSGSANSDPDKRNSASFKHHSAWDKAVEERVEFTSHYGFPDITRAYEQPAEGDDGYVPLTMLGAVSSSVTVFGLSGLQDERQIIRFGAAALLNARYTDGYPLSEELVRNIVADTLTVGYYIANSGDSLEPEQVKAFLENTMNIPNWGP